MRSLLLLLASALVLVAGAGCDGPESVTPVVPVTASFNVSSEACQNAQTRTFTRVALTDHAIVWADDKNPAPTLTNEQYQAVADSFEAIVWPTLTGVFGTPTDIDGNGRVHILYTTAVNDLSPSNSTSYIGGFFYARDLYPRSAGTFNGIRFGGESACPTSNQGEVFYMLAADENGTVKGNVRSRSLVRRVTLGTIAHEFQHLINASLRIYRTNSYFEDTWLDEGLSHVAEELTFFVAGSAQPLQNYDLNAVRSVETRRLAFNKLMTQNMARFNTYLEKGPTASPYDSNDSLATRGGAWSWLRYLADRKGGNQEAFFRSLVQSNVRGMENVQRALGADPYPFLSGYHLASYADDLVATPALLQQPSWHFRDLLTLFGGYGLRTFPLVSGVTSRVAVDGGGAAHFRVAVAPLGEGTVRIGEAGLLPLGTCTAGAQRVSVGVGESVAFSPGPAAMCLVGGPAGAEFVVAAVHASPAPTRDPGTGTTPNNPALVLHALASGVTAPPLAGAYAGDASLAKHAAEAEAPGHAIEQEIRRRERALPPPSGQRAPSFSRLGDQGIVHLLVSVLRTK